MNKNEWLICLCFRDKASAIAVGSKIVVRILNPYEARTVDTLIGNSETVTRSEAVLAFLFGEEHRKFKRIDWFGERRSGEDENSALYQARTWLRHLELERRPGLLGYPRHKNYPSPFHQEDDQEAINPRDVKEGIPKKESTESASNLHIASEPKTAPKEASTPPPFRPQIQKSKERPNITPMDENRKRAVLREWLSIIRRGVLRG